jgi:hypothetical protein
VDVDHAFVPEYAAQTRPVVLRVVEIGRHAL